MEQRMLEQIFEPFFTTRLDGNGLGLATVRAIIAEHGGALNVVSAPGAGSTFEVWLPLARADEYAPRAASSAVSRGHGETIMLIDDVADQRLRNEDIVAALGYEPVGFARADEALAAFRLTPTRFDAVLISHLVPTDMALELAGVLRHVAPRVPILFAASTDEISADMLTAAGIDEVVPRSFTWSDLASALARSLATGAVASA
jgi:CheY-like chemotaxis protein